MIQSSAYPKSVNPGIPKDLPTPKGWSKVKYGDFLYPVHRPIKLIGDAQYQLVTVKRSRGGVVLREILNGREIKTPNQSLIKEGDFLISRRQIVHGACGIVPRNCDNSIVSSEYSILHSHPGLDVNFFSYFAHTPYFQQTCFHSSVGVHVEKMIFKLDKWREWEFNLPPLLEQRKIAEILSTWDKAIALLEQLITAKRKLKQGLMQQLLTGKKRFKEFCSETIKQENIFNSQYVLPNQWQIVSLGDVSSITKLAGFEYTEHFDYSIGGDIILIRGLNIKYGSLNLKEIHTIPRETSDALQRSKLFCGDIVMGYVGTIGEAALITENDKYHLAPNVAKITPNSLKLSPVFFHKFIYSSFFQNELKKLTSRSSQPALSMTNIRKAKVILPSISEQQKIASILSAADTEISTLEKQLAAYKQQKRGLMQQLLTGKKRVKIDELQMQQV